MDARSCNCSIQTANVLLVSTNAFAVCKLTMFVDVSMAYANKAANSSSVRSHPQPVSIRRRLPFGITAGAAALIMQQCDVPDWLAGETW